MSARPLPPIVEASPAAVLAPMQLSDVLDVATVERSIYTAPWTEGNFVDSLNAGYGAWTLRRRPYPARRLVAAGAAAFSSTRAPLIGYFVLMAAVDEAHLLNVSVALPFQRQGFGLYLLREAIGFAREHRASSVILEVRPSNERALAVYRRFGFREHGLRRRYYPASSDDQQSREDAIVMRLALSSGSATR